MRQLGQDIVIFLLVAALAACVVMAVVSAALPAAPLPAPRFAPALPKPKFKGPERKRGAGKSCPCSPACVCGCNAGLPCRCDVRPAVIVPSRLPLRVDDCVR